MHVLHDSIIIILNKNALLATTQGVFYSMDLIFLNRWP
jgi:hypothetical protein